MLPDPLEILAAAHARELRSAACWARLARASRADAPSFAGRASAVVARVPAAAIYLMTGESPVGDARCR